MAASGEIRCPRMGRSDGRRHAWGSPIRALLERTFGRSVVSDPHPHRSRRHHPHSRVGHHPARSEVFALRLLRRSMGPRAADIERIRGCWTENRPINGLLRPCEQAPRVIGPPDFGRLLVPKGPQTPVFPGPSRRKRARDRPCALTKAPQSCSRPFPTPAYGSPHFCSRPPRRWGEPMATGGPSSGRRRETQYRV